MLATPFHFHPFPFTFNILYTEFTHRAFHVYSSLSFATFSRNGVRPALFALFVLPQPSSLLLFVFPNRPPGFIVKENWKKCENVSRKLPHSPEYHLCQLNMHLWKGKGQHFCGFISYRYRIIQSRFRFHKIDEN
jgi:hypothetical protein